MFATRVIKLVADRDRDVLVRATSMGPTGGEVLDLLTPDAAVSQVAAAMRPTHATLSSNQATWTASVSLAGTCWGNDTMR